MIRKDIDMETSRRSFIFKGFATLPMIALGFKNDARNAQSFKDDLLIEAEKTLISHVYDTACPSRCDCHSIENEITSFAEPWLKSGSISGFYAKCLCAGNSLNLRCGYKPFMNHEWTIIDVRVN